MVEELGFRVLGLLRMAYLVVFQSYMHAPSYRFLEPKLRWARAKRARCFPNSESLDPVNLDVSDFGFQFGDFGLGV